jgi:putative phosphoribosyl transferase
LVKQKITTNQTIMVFKDRQDAGEQLAKLLAPYAAERPIILGMPRGGVVVAAVIAKALKAPLDIIVARKIGSPLQPEYAIGAIAPGDVRIVNPEAISYLDIDNAEIEAIVQREKKEMERRIKFYRGTRPPLEVKDRIVIIVDDGIATGQTALAAILSIKKLQPKKIILAAGVCAREAVALLKPEVDAVICVSIPEEFQAVGLWYQNFAQTTDAEVISLLLNNY